MNMDRQKIDAFLLSIWPILAVLLSLYFSVDYLGSILFFFVIPSVYLSFRNSDMILKVSIFSASLAVPVALIADSFFHATKTYIINTTVFPFRVFGLFPIESFLWGFFGAYLPVMFYEYFIHHHSGKRMAYPRMKYLGVVSLVFTLSSFIIFSEITKGFNLPYAYLIIGTFFVGIPVIVELYEYPGVLKKWLLVGGYFFILSFLYELTALKLDLWTYYSDYTSFLGWVIFMGEKFPFEEIIFWFSLLSFAVISLYDLLDDYPNRDILSDEKV